MKTLMLGVALMVLGLVPAATVEAQYAYAPRSYAPRAYTPGGVAPRPLPGRAQRPITPAEAAYAARRQAQQPSTYAPRRAPTPAEAYASLRLAQQAAMNAPRRAPTLAATAYPPSSPRGVGPGLPGGAYGAYGGSDCPPFHVIYLRGLGQVGDAGYWDVPLYGYGDAACGFGGTPGYGYGNPAYLYPGYGYNYPPTPDGYPAFGQGTAATGIGIPIVPN